MYMDSISHMFIPYVAVVHKQVEVQMADASRPSIKFTDLSREFMSLSATNEEGQLIPMFDVIMPLTIGMHCGSAMVTYRHDNRELLFRSEKSGKVLLHGGTAIGLT